MNDLQGVAQKSNGSLIGKFLHRNMVNFENGGSACFGSMILILLESHFFS